MSSSSSASSSSSTSLSSTSTCLSIASPPKSVMIPAAPRSPTHPLRKNEHLAILLPRHLWKPDSASNTCDHLPCRRRFTILERRHHCRMCGGLFCQACSSQTTPLLDNTNLVFHLVPRGASVHHFHSPSSPVSDSRVCTACHDHLHGRLPRGHLSDPSIIEPPRSSARRSKPRRIPVSLAPSPASSYSSSSLSTPPDVLPVSPTDSTSTGAISLLQPPKRTRTASMPSPRHSPRSRALLLHNTANPTGRPPTLAEIAPELANLSLGELDAYPLRFPSAICKALGGGRWEPKAAYVPALPCGKPGTKDFLRKPLEKEEIKRRERLANPVTVDGDFHYRLPGPPAPPPPPRFPREATF